MIKRCIPCIPELYELTYGLRKQAAPGVRMGALSNLQVIHIATHDSFRASEQFPEGITSLTRVVEEGQNGPTHQPVEVDSLFRAMPNLLYIRPCDAEELIGAWIVALESTKNPSMLSLARDPVGFVPNTDRSKVSRGAYVIHEPRVYKVTLASAGSNIHYAVAAGESLTKQGIPTRIVSAPSLDLFEIQEDSYKESVFPLDGCPIISVEEYVATVWARYVTASIGMTTYGYSASNPSNYKRFGLDNNSIERKVKSYLEWLNGRSARDVAWKQL